MPKNYYGMLLKWSKLKNNNQLDVLKYIQDCENGYPRGSQLKKPLLRTRALGIIEYANQNNILLINADEVTKYLTR